MRSTQKTTETSSIINLDLINLLSTEAKLRYDLYETEEIKELRHNTINFLNTQESINNLRVEIERGIFENSINDHVDEYINYKCNSFETIYNLRFNKIREIIDQEGWYKIMTHIIQ